MNRKQKLTGVIFAIIILITSFVILERAALAGIIGLCASVGLFIYYFSGSSGESLKKYSFKAMLKSKIVKRILIAGIVLVIIFIILGIIISIQYEQSRKVEEQRKEAEDQRKIQASIQNSKYLQNIEVTSSKVELENPNWEPVRAYLFIAIKNKGDRIVNSLTMRLNYYDNGKYLISQASVATPGSIQPGEERRFKIYLNHNDYPYSQSDKINNFEIKLISCKTFRITFLE